MSQVLLRFCLRNLFAKACAVELSVLTGVGGNVCPSTWIIRQIIIPD